MQTVGSRYERWDLWLGPLDSAVLLYRNYVIQCCYHGPLTRYVKLRVAHVPGMPETFSPPPRVSDPDMYHGTCVTHVPWCMPGSLISGFLWSRCRWKRSRHSLRMRNPQFYVSGKRPIPYILDIFHPVQFKSISLASYSKEKASRAYNSHTTPYQRPLLLTRIH